MRIYGNPTCSTLQVTGVEQGEEHERDKPPLKRRGDMAQVMATAEFDRYLSAVAAPDCDLLTSHNPVTGR